MTDATVSKHLKAIEACAGADRKSRDALAIEFGRRRGWKVGKYFDRSQLSGIKGQSYNWVDNDDYNGRPVDHVEYYWATNGSYTLTGRKRIRPIALVGHLYERNADVQKFASDNGLIAETPTDFPSWWAPGMTRLVVYTRAPKAE